MSKYIHKLDYQIVEAQQIVRKQDNELHFNNGDIELFPEGAFLTTKSNPGDWIINMPDGDRRIMNAAEFSNQYENHFQI